MKDNLISLTTAKLAKKKGFNIPTNLYYWFSKHHYNGISGYTYKNSNLKNTGISFLQDKKNWNSQDRYEDAFYSAPTQTLLQKWLREKYNCFVEVSLHGEEDNIWNINPENLLFGVTVDYYGKSFEIPMTDEEDYSEYNFKSYEKALEKGLQEALKLIKNV